MYLSMFNTIIAAMVTRGMLGCKNKDPPPGGCVALSVGLSVGGGVDVTGGGDVDETVCTTDVGAIVTVGSITVLGLGGPKHCGFG